MVDTVDWTQEFYAYVSDGEFPDEAPRGLVVVDMRGEDVEAWQPLADLSINVLEEILANHGWQVSGEWSPEPYGSGVSVVPVLDDAGQSVPVIVEVPVKSRGLAVHLARKAAGQMTALTSLVVDPA